MIDKLDTSKEISEITNTNPNPIKYKRGRIIPWVIGISLVIILIIIYFCYLRNSNNQNPTTNNSQSSSQVNISTKTYTNQLYPDLYIKYDDSWKIQVEELSDDNFGNGETNTLITLQKETTSLYFDISVGTPMGGELSCYSKEDIPYIIISDKLLRYKNSNYGNFYWRGSIVKEIEENRFNETLSYYTDAFNCQEDNSCELCAVLAYQTTITNTIYPLPANMVTEKVKNYRALVRIYVKQNQENQTLLNEADKIVVDSLELIK